MATNWHAVQVAMGAALGAAADATPTPGVNITVDIGADEDFTQSIGAVFVDPPASIEPGLLPCILLGDDAFEDEWDSSLAREHYEQEAFLLLRDEDAEVALHLAKAYRQDIKRVLRANLKLGMGLVGIHGARFGGLGVVEYAGARYLGFRFTVALLVTDPAPGFAAGVSA